MDNQVGSLHILVIDDDPDTRANLRDILELDNYRVEVAGSAAEALARGDWASYSAIILDRRLPDTTADELLPRLRRAAPDAAVIVVTGYADLHGAISALRHGATDYILKPIEAEGLRARLRHVAEYRHAQEALRLAERRYRLLVQNSSDIITAFDADGTVLYQSPAIERMLGYGPEERIGKNIFRDPITHPNDLAAKQTFLDEARRRRGVPVTAEFRLQHADGSWRSIEAVGQDLLDEPGVCAIVANYRDVTERKRADEALRRERDFAQGLIDSAPAIVLVLDAEGRIVRFNRFAEELSGYRAEDVLGRDYFALLLPDRDRARIGDVFRRTLEDVDTSGTVNAIATKDGREREIRWSNRVLKDAESRSSGVLAIGQDITDLREAEERALRAERLAAIGQVVAGLAHESRNALQRSQACLEMLALQVRDRPEALDLIARLQRAQDHLHHLYEDVRGYAAPIRLERRDCDLSRIWREAWAHLEPQRKGRSASLRDGWGDEPDLRCVVDPFRLEQVFRNILENALAACPDPVEVEIRCSRAEVDGLAALRVAVRDNGPGLGSEDCQRIFEPFYTTKTKGTGLGMAIARRIVEAHGGRIAAGEGTARGAEIVITLPRGEP